MTDRLPSGSTPGSTLASYATPTQPLPPQRNPPSPLASSHALISTTRKTSPTESDKPAPRTNHPTVISVFDVSPDHALSGVTRGCGRRLRAPFLNARATRHLHPPQPALRSQGHTNNNNTYIHVTELSLFDGSGPLQATQQHAAMSRRMRHRVAHSIQDSASPTSVRCCVEPVGRACRRDGGASPGSHTRFFQRSAHRDRSECGSTGRAATKVNNPDRTACATCLRRMLAASPEMGGARRGRAAMLIVMEYVMPMNDESDDPHVHITLSSLIGHILTAV